jgi:hypothetical protein
MYIAKLKDGPQWAKKTFSIILERGFELVLWSGRKWNHIKKDLWSWSVFLLSKYWLPILFKETLRAFFLFFLCSVSWGLGVFDDMRRKSLLQKPLFKWYDMECHGHDYGCTGGRWIFWNGVMHANIAKLWLWRCESCGYISGGHIIRSGGMHANISRWV